VVNGDHRRLSTLHSAKVNCCSSCLAEIARCPIHCQTPPPALLIPCLEPKAAPLCIQTGRRQNPPPAATNPRRQNSLFCHALLQQSPLWLNTRKGGTESCNCQTDAISDRIRTVNCNFPREEVRVLRILILFPNFSKIRSFRLQILHFLTKIFDNKKYFDNLSTVLPLPFGHYATALLQFW